MYCWQPAVVAGEETAEPTPSVEQSVVEAEEAPAAELPTEELVAVPVEIPVETPPPPSIAAPTISVDSMIANSLGNIFRKKVVKDTIYQALLDHHPNMDTATYTHLRAHETRHGRVCRLLLDKKQVMIRPIFLPAPFLLSLYTNIPS